MNEEDVATIISSNKEFEDRIRYIVDEDLRMIVEVLKRKVDQYNDNIQKISDLTKTESRRHSRTAQRMSKSLEYQNRELQKEINIIEKQYQNQLDKVIYGTRGRRFKVIERMSDMLMSSQLLFASISNIDMKNMRDVMNELDAIREDLQEWNILLTREYWKMGIFNRDFNLNSLDIIPIKMKDMNVVREIIARLNDQLQELEDYWDIEIRENPTPTIDPQYFLIHL